MLLLVGPDEAERNVLNAREATHVRSMKVVVAGLALSAILALAGCGSAADGEPVRAMASTSDGTSPSSPEAQDIIATTRRMAQEWGEPDPQDIQWVHARDINGTVRLLAGEDDVLVAQPEEDRPVIVVFARGTFETPSALSDVGEPTEPQEASRPRPYLYQMIDAVTGEPAGTMVNGRLVDLSVLGQVTHA